MTEARVLLPPSFVEHLTAQLEHAPRETSWESLANNAAQLRQHL